YTTVVETFATTGAFEAIKDRGERAVGVANSTDFLRPHSSGRLDVVAVPVHQAARNSFGRSRSAGPATASWWRVVRCACRTSLRDGRAIRRPLTGSSMCNQSELRARSPNAA